MCKGVCKHVCMILHVRILLLYVTYCNIICLCCKDWALWPARQLRCPLVGRSMGINLEHQMAGQLPSASLCHKPLITIITIMIMVVAVIMIIIIIIIIINKKHQQQYHCRSQPSEGTLHMFFFVRKNDVGLLSFRAFGPQRGDSLQDVG